MSCDLDIKSKVHSLGLLTQSLGGIKFTQVWVNGLCKVYNKEKWHSKYVRSQNKLFKKNKIPQERIFFLELEFFELSFLSEPWLKCFKKFWLINLSFKIKWIPEDKNKYKNDESITSKFSTLLFSLCYVR